MPTPGSRSRQSLADEKAVTAAAFLRRATTFFAAHGITVERVLTDNGSCYRWHLFDAALPDGARHTFTRPHRPQTNGKVERYNRTLGAELAYARPWTCEPSAPTTSNAGSSTTTTTEPTPPSATSPRPPSPRPLSPTS
jgi:transposase InsO family protein